ncbi:MAG: chorismate mutase [Phascolarctobacterium faecium]
MDLEAIRRRIGSIDAQLVAALEERMEAVLEVAAYKKQQGLPVLDAAPGSSGALKGLYAFTA